MNPGLSAEQAERIWELSSQGYTNRQTAQAMSINQSTVWRVLQRAKPQRACRCGRNKTGLEYGCCAECAAEKWMRQMARGEGVG